MKLDKPNTTTMRRLRAALQGGTALPRLQTDPAPDREPLLDQDRVVIRPGSNWHLLEAMIASKDATAAAAAPEQDRERQE